ncbi:MAG: LacI family DNA-binding transcriptional regulator [Firmicutes bacterium]|nr:LacI family DNA-binding transcriptional regulator [Bacillota bacterium]
MTLADVAKRAGVSPSTVSRVVNQNGYVSEEVAERVRRAVEELDYRPNVIARSFRSKTTMTIGVVVSEITNPYFMEALRGIEEVLSPEGYLMLIASSSSVVEKELQYCMEFDRRRVDGIILASAGSSAGDLNNVFRGRSPVVLIDRIVEGAEFDCVLDDNDEGVRMLVDYLIGEGHRKFGIISGPTRITAGKERTAAFEKHLARYGCSVPPEWKWIGDAFSVEYGQAAGEVIATLPVRPSTVFCANNVLTTGLLLAFQRHGVKVPDDVSVVSYGALENGELFSTTITQIEQPARETGRVAAARLLQRMRHKDLPFEVVRMPPRLVIGRSVRALNSYHNLPE